MIPWYTALIVLAFWSLAVFRLGVLGERRRCSQVVARHTPLAPLELFELGARIRLDIAMVTDPESIEDRRALRNVCAERGCDHLVEIDGSRCADCVIVLTTENVQ